MARMRERPFRGARDDWKTPRWVLERLGSFTMDPSGGTEDDGLMMPWEGCVFINPPYGPWTGKWCDRLLLHGDGIALVAARTDTTWFQRAANAGAALFFFRGRLRFDEGEGRPMFPSALIAVGHCRCRLQEFTFNEGVVVVPPLMTEMR